jgi:hypothetical protein
MPRSRTSNRRKASLGKVSVKPKSRTVPKTSRFQNSSLEYDEKKSQFANYKRLDLLADSNQIGAVRDRVTGFKPRVKGPSAQPTGSSQPHVLEMEMPEALKTVRRVPPGERKVLLKLIARHGDDHTAMARDAKLNTLQHTAAHLRHRIGKLREDDAEAEEEAVTAAAADLQPPEPRGKRKLTRDPNPAFKKRAMNFS